MRRLLRKIFKPTGNRTFVPDEAKILVELRALFNNIEKDYPLDPPHGQYWN